MPDISKRLERAEKYVQKGKLDSAIEEYLVAWKEDPGNNSVVEVVADLYQRQNQPKNALECLGYLFDKHVEEREGAKAIMVFRKMAKLGPQEPARMLAYANLQQKQKPDEAQENYRLAAQMLLERGDRVRALDALRGLAALNDLNSDAHLQVAQVAESLGQKETAAAAFVRAGELLKGGQSPEKALEHLEHAYTLAPNDPRVCQGLAAAVFESGNPKRAAELLEPFAVPAVPERNRLLADAHVASGNFARAEDLLWELAPNAPEAYKNLMRVAEGYLRARNAAAALNLMRRLKTAMFAARQDREFISFIEALEEKRIAGLEVLEFLSSVYNELNYDSAFSGTMVRLFDLYVEAGGHLKASNALDHLVDVDPYNSEHDERLHKLAGHIEPRRYEALAARIRQTATTTQAQHDAPGEAAEPEAGAPAGDEGGAEGEGGGLEDLVLQAEIFLQYGLKPRAVEKLQKIARQFPGEENRNDKLRSLYAAAGFVPKAVPGDAGSHAQTATPPAEEFAADLTRISEITRNIYRQGTVKTVLSTSVNEIGKTWKVSRCVAGLCTPGKPPSAALEFCATGVKPSDVMSIVKLVTTLVQFTSDGNPLPVEDVASSSKLAKLAPVTQALEVQSMLALPMIDGDVPIGVVILEQCDRMRRWRSNEIMVLKTVVDQMVIATAHVKLRSLMKTLAVTDERSGLLNRNNYLECLLSECVRGQKQNTPLSVALLQFGYAPQKMRELGDEVVQQFMQDAGTALVAHLRQNDIGVRYDKTTLALVLPDTKGKDTFFVVDKLRKVAAAIKIGEREGLPLAAGIAEAILNDKMDGIDSVTELINRLEAALDEASKDGAGARLLMPPEDPLSVRPE